MDERDMEHGRNWRSQDVTGWHASEKLDGCRAYWDGEVLWTRSGRPVTLPSELARQLPLTHLDGEIYAGTGRREEARAALVHGKWQGVRFMVFDAPLAEGDWPTRLAKAALGLRGSTWAQSVVTVEVQGHAHLAALYRAVKARQGEGLILRWPGSRCYHAGRTDQILKLKRDPRPWWARLLAA